MIDCSSNNEHTPTLIKYRAGRLLPLTPRSLPLRSTACCPFEEVLRRSKRPLSGFTPTTTPPLHSPPALAFWASRHSCRVREHALTRARCVPDRYISTPALCAALDERRWSTIKSLQSRCAPRQDGRKRYLDPPDIVLDITHCWGHVARKESFIKSA
jgi:hypothetical protein